MKIEFPDKDTIESLVPEDFKFSLRLEVRWEDVDMYQHINNAKYYSFFDTTVNTNLVNQGLLDPEEGGAVFYVVENRCQFLVPIPFPLQIEVGLRTEILDVPVSHMGWPYSRRTKLLPQLLLTTHMCMSTEKQTDQRKYLHNCGNTLNH